MLLLNVNTYKLERFSDERSFPPYAILSHTWTDGKEVQYANIVNSTLSERNEDLDWKKIDFTCRQVVADGLKYAWIDTCCIDKSSSAELSEAINSMFRWYQKAKICYVYMSDVASSTQTSKENSEGQKRSTLRTNFLTESDSDPWRLSVDWMVLSQTQKPDFRQSRWFTRGWTLQELLASSTVVFYDRNWTPLGDRIALVPDISAVTGIPSDILHGHTPLRNIGVAVRMSWASRRQTTRIEDEAYCLLGIFDVNMPLLYGEGGKAFLRLQEEILKLLAPSPANFAKSASIVPRKGPRAEDDYEMTTRGCRISLPILVYYTDQNYYEILEILAILDCIDLAAPTADVCIALMNVESEEANGRTTELALFPIHHNLCYVECKERHSRYRYQRNAREVKKVSILRYQPDRPAAKFTTLQLALVGDLEDAPRQVFPARDWSLDMKCIDTTIDAFRVAVAVWIRLPPDTSTPKQARLATAGPRTSGISGVIFAWKFLSESRSDLVRVAHGVCGYDDAPHAARDLWNKLENDIPSKARLFIGIGEKFALSHRWDQQRLRRDQVVTFRWHGITLSFSCEPIGIRRSGIMVVVDRADVIESRRRRLERLVVGRPLRMSRFASNVKLPSPPSFAKRTFEETSYASSW